MEQPTAGPRKLSRCPVPLRPAARSLALVAFAVLMFAASPVRAQNRTAIHKIQPVYPPIAKQLGISGTVVVTATVDASGNVIKAESNSGNKLLASSAIDAVKQWKFAPGDKTESLSINVNFEKN